MASGIIFKPADPADIATPPTGKVTFFLDESTGEPAFKDDEGNVTPVRGADGATGPTGPTGPTGDAGADGEGVPVGGTAGQVLTKQSSTDGDADWETPGGGVFRGARVYSSANQSIPQGADTPVTFDSERFDTDGFHSTGSDTARLTIPSGQGGKYLIIGHVEIASNSSTWRATSIVLNGTTAIASQSTNAISSGNTYLTVSTVYDLAPGDYVTLNIFIANGPGSLASIADGNRAPEFSIVKLG